MRDVNILRKGENYTIGTIGRYEELKEYSYNHPLLNMDIEGKVFLGEKLNMSSMEVSFQILKAGKEIPFDHKHNENEEVYIVIKGSGEFIVDGEVTLISEGSIIRIAAEGKRRWKSHESEDLIMMVLQAKEGSLNKFTVTDGSPA